MATDTQTTTLLNEAAAIVEAEWMRLQQDELWHEVAELFAEMPAPPRPAPRGRRDYPRPAAMPTAARSPAPLAPRGWPAKPVWATQRSPPRDEEVLLKGTVGQGR